LWEDSKSGKESSEDFEEGGVELVGNVVRGGEGRRIFGLHSGIALE
jgi:hypothetical protein